MAGRPRELCQVCAALLPPTPIHPHPRHHHHHDLCSYSPWPGPAAHAHAGHGGSDLPAQGLCARPPSPTTSLRGPCPVCGLARMRARRAGAWRWRAGPTPRRRGPSAWGCCCACWSAAASPSQRCGAPACRAGVRGRFTDGLAARADGARALASRCRGGGGGGAQALLGLAARLQSTPGPDAALLREATYRCIGEGFSHVSPHVTFSAW